MINGISTWTKSIILAVVVATILEMILPEGNSKKYIKTVIGIYILFTIISPIISKLNGGNIEINTLKYENYFNTKNYMQASVNAIDTDLDSTYIASVKSDIKQRMREKGYKTRNIEVDIELNDKQRYGTIKNLKLTLSREQKGESNINTISKVEINISNEQNKIEESALAENEKNEIKRYLMDTYSIEKDKIEIY